MLTLRLATLEDAAAIDDIYEHYVHASTCTYQRDPDPPDARVKWLSSHGPSHPVIVAEIEDAQKDAIVGFGSLSPFRDRWGYRHTVKSSVYVHKDHHRKGIGREIMIDLIARARLLGHHTIIAGISAEQTASVALHERLGFREVARFREVGHKFDRWLDVIFMQRMLDAPS